MEAEIDELERIEERLVLAEIEAGRPVGRRRDARPEAILDVKIVEKRTAPAPESGRLRVAS